MSSLAHREWVVATDRKRKQKGKGGRESKKVPRKGEDARQVPRLIRQSSKIDTITCLLGQAKSKQMGLAIFMMDRHKNQEETAICIILLQ
jgi:hypothetical protein